MNIAEPEIRSYDSDELVEESSFALTQGGSPI